jgi:hypothetical protein
MTTLLIVLLVIFFLVFVLGTCYLVFGGTVGAVKWLAFLFTPIWNLQRKTRFLVSGAVFVIGLAGFSGSIYFLTVLDADFQNEMSVFTGRLTGDASQTPNLDTDVAANRVVCFASETKRYDKDCAPDGLAANTATEVGYILSYSSQEETLGRYDNHTVARRINKKVVLFQVNPWKELASDTLVNGQSPPKERPDNGKDWVATVSNAQVKNWVNQKLRLLSEETPDSSEPAEPGPEPGTTRQNIGGRFTVDVPDTLVVQGTSPTRVTPPGDNPAWRMELRVDMPYISDFADCQAYVAAWERKSGTTSTEILVGNLTGNYVTGNQDAFVEVAFCIPQESIDIMVGKIVLQGTDAPALLADPNVKTMLDSVRPV